MNGRALVAWNLRRVRVKRGLSQERLAFDAGVDQSYLGGLERQEENPTVDVLDRLASTLSIPISIFCFARERFVASQTIEKWSAPGPIEGAARVTKFFGNTARFRRRETEDSTVQAWVQ